MTYSINDQIVDNHAFTIFACNPNNNIIVKACAGSGKTWLLASRILRILIEGSNIENILAITFTKKSAQEMQDRVIEWLKQFSSFSQEQLSKELYIRGIEPSVKNLIKAKNLYFKILSSPYKFNISTFHVWFMQLLNIMPLEYHKNYNNLRQDSNILYEEALKDFIESQIYTKYSDIFNQFSNLWQENIFTSKILKDIWNKRHQFLHNFEFNNDNFIFPSNETINALKNIAIPNLQLTIKHQDISNQILALLDKKNNSITNNIKDNILKAIKNNSLKELTESLINTNFAIRSIDRTKNNIIQTEFEEYSAIILADYYELYNKAYLSIGELLVKIYLHYKQKNNIIEFNDIEIDIFNLLKQDEIANYVWCRLDNKYKHILFDEFQDTNYMQWQIIINWLKAYEFSMEKPSIFIVGDKKQSIYKFRGSDSRILDAASDFLSNQYNVQILATYNTRRCSAKIIDWLNNSLCLEQIDDYKPHSTTVMQGKTYLLPIIEDLEQSKNQLVNTIKYLSQSYKYNEILILTSTRNKWKDFEEALKKKNIPCLLEIRGGLLQSPEIYLIFNFIRFLVDNTDKYSLFNILNSKIFSHELVDKFINFDEDIDYVNMLKNLISNNTLYNNDKNYIAKILEIKNKYKICPPLEIIQYILINFNLSKHFILNMPFRASQIQNNIDNFFNLILEFNAGRYPSLNSLLQYLQKYQYTEYLSETPNKSIENSNNGVYFDTVHGAKGLEYEAVVIFDTNNYKEFTTNFLISKNNKFIGNKNKLIQFAGIDWQIEKQLTDDEYKNSLYVAMTRAKQTLVVGGAIVKPKKNQNENESKNWFNLLKNSHEIHELQINTVEKNNTINFNYKSDKIIESTEFNIKNKIQNNIGQEIGSIMHILMERICRFRDNNYNIAIPSLEKAQNWLKIAPHKKFILKIALEKVELILNAQNLEYIFNPHLYKKAYCELSFYHKSKVYRMDRIIQKNNNDWLIIDYKLGDEQKHINEYQKQLNIYKYILSKSYKIELSKISAGILNSNCELNII